MIAWMIADVLHSTGRMLARDVVCAHARLTFDHDHQLLGPSDVSAATGRGGHASLQVVDPYCDGVGGAVRLSGPFDCLREIEIGVDGRRARYGASDQPISKRIPAMLLDAAWRVGAMYADVDVDDLSGEKHSTDISGDLYVPVRIGRMIIPVASDKRSAAGDGLGDPFAPPAG